MDEKKLEAAVNKYAKSKGIRSIKMTSVNDNGLPDRMYLFKGNAIFIEFKGFGKLNTTTALQKKNLRDLSEMGFKAVVVDTLDMGKRHIDLLDARDPPIRKAQYNIMRAYRDLEGKDIPGGVSVPDLSKIIGMAIPNGYYTHRLCEGQGLLERNTKHNKFVRYRLTDYGRKISIENDALLIRKQKKAEERKKRAAEKELAEKLALEAEEDALGDNGNTEEDVWS